MADEAIVVAQAVHAAEWLALRAALWPGEDEEHRVAIGAALTRADPECLALLAFSGEEAVGLAEASIRHDYVNGCDGSPVAFLEGLYVAERWRRRNIGRRLVDRVADWGRAAGCREFASDAAVENVASHRLHQALGFAETERVVFFRRGLAA